MSQTFFTTNGHPLILSFEHWTLSRGVKTVLTVHTGHEAALRKESTILLGMKKDELEPEDHIDLYEQLMKKFQM